MTGVPVEDTVADKTVPQRETTLKVSPKEERPPEDDRSINVDEDYSASTAFSAGTTSKRSATMP